ncbi:(2,3-dihydroxybenzoyl)adenylate synthase [Streptomyces sp. DSM 118878]
MLAGCTDWPEAVAAGYREDGLWRGEALGVLLRRGAQRHPDRTALVAQGSRWTYARLDELVDRRAAGFAERGIATGDRVVVQLPNVAEFVVVCFALWRIGACPVFCLPSYRAVEVEHLCGLTGPVAYVIPDIYLGHDYRPLADAMRQRFPSLRDVFVVGDSGGHTAITDVVAAARRFTEPDPGDVAFFLLSGGTTGLPKLIPRTHDDYGYQVRASAELCGLTPHSVYLAVLPVEFNFTWGCPGVMGALAAGGTAVLAVPSATDDLFALVGEEGVTFTSLVPSLVHQWLDEVACTTNAPSGLEVLQVGGAPLHQDLAARAARELGCTLQQVYGMAEGLLCLTRLDSPRRTVLGTQGRPLSDADELLVVDAEGREVPPGEPGELLTRGPYTLRGYYRGGDHNTLAFTSDGFYRTGDLVRVLSDGSVVVEGRRKEVIIRGGDKVSPVEIEGYLLDHPGVRQVAVVGIPHPLLGESTCACVVAGEEPLDLARLRGALQRRGVADYKLPDRLEILPGLPVTALGKVDKKRLAAQLSAGGRP